MMLTGTFIKIFGVLGLFVFVTSSASALDNSHLSDVEPKAFHLRRQSQLVEMRVGSRSSRSGSGGGGGLGFSGFFLGPVVFIISFIMVWNNERKAAIDYRRLNLASSIVKEVNPFVADQMYSNDSNLIHITGTTQTNMNVVDSISGVSLNNCIKIERQVEVKQFRARDQSDNDNNHHIQYELIWVTSNSSQEHDRFNDPSKWFLQNQVTTAPEVTIGNYILNQSQKQRLKSQSQYHPNQQDANTILQRTGHNNQYQIVNNYIYFPSQYGNIQSHGTLRVKFYYCEVGPTSIIAKADKNSFQPFRIDEYENGTGDSNQGFNCGLCCLSSCIAQIFKPITEIDIICQETISYQQMMKREIDMHQCITWAIRIGTYFLMVLGICLFFSPITDLLGYVPFVGGFLKTAVGIAIFIAALIICIPLWLITFAISWLVFHPKVGIILLVIALGISGIILGITYSKNKQS